jgi:hypothetical protein
MGHALRLTLTLLSSQFSPRLISAFLYVTVNDPTLVVTFRPSLSGLFTNGRKDFRIRVRRDRPSHAHSKLCPLWLRPTRHSASHRLSLLNCRVASLAKCE